LVGRLRKFQDGLLSATVAAALIWTPLRDLDKIQGLGPMEKTLIRGVTGGTASAIGGGKFANGASTAAFQSLITELPNFLIKGEWAFPDGKDINNVEKIYTNGILGVNEAQQRANAAGAAIYFNPSNGFLADAIESGFQKFLGFFGDPLTKGFAEQLRYRSRSVVIVAHSQGTITAVNAAMFYNAVPSGSTLVLDSPAITYARAWIATKMIGGSLSYNQRWGDAANLWAISINPLKFASGIIDVPIGFKIHIKSNSFENPR
jgi:hypothetical protein